MATLPNYSINVAQPFAEALKGYKLGMDLEVSQQEQMLKQQAAQQEMEQKRQTQAAFARLRQPGATAADYANLAMMLPEAQAKAVRESFSMLNSEKQGNILRQTGNVFAAFKSKQPEIAINLIDQQVAAMRNSGDEVGAKSLEMWGNVARQNPQAAEDYFGFVITQMPGGDKVIEGAVKLAAERRTEAMAPSALKEAEGKARKSLADAQKAEQDALNAALTAEDDIAKAQAQARFEAAKAQREEAEAEVAKLTVGTRVGKAASEAETAAVNARFAEQLAKAGLDKTNWDIKNLQSQINDRAAKLNLDRQTTAATVAEKMSSIQARLTDIPEGARKLINESATLASTSKQAATQYNDLARRIEAAEGGKGFTTTATEWFAKQFGQQDAWTQIRNEYTRVRNSVAIKSLPPGVATDKDIELALKGIPPENANAATLASFLRGTAKLQDIDSAINNAKTDWLSQNNGLLTRAKSSFIAGDYAAKPGETFNDFAQRIVGDVSQKYRSPAQIAEERRQQAIAQIPTTAAPAAVPAAPAATPASVMSQADAILRGGR